MTDAQYRDRLESLFRQFRELTVARFGGPRFWTEELTDKLILVENATARLSVLSRRLGDGTVIRQKSP